MLSKLFGKKRPAAPEMVIVRLNARLQPMHRGEFFEDPLDAKLKPAGLGEVSGGGTMQDKSGEIEYCDIELQMSDVTDATIDQLVALLEQLGAPKGSKVQIASSQAERDIGRAEGMAVYLNGTDLPDETYKSCDSNLVYSELDRLLAGKGRVLSYWQGPTETAFYLYGDSFDDMKRRTAEFLATYPLCAKCRVTRVA